MPTFTIKATIPTGQYANLQPEYSVEADTFEEAEKTAMPRIEKLWSKYFMAGDSLSKGTTAAERVKLVSELCGGAYAWFDEANHIYTNDAGEACYMSGSVFAHKFVPEFDKNVILPAMAKAYSVSANDIEEMWNTKSNASMSFGTGIHAALELYGKHKELGAITGAKKEVNSAMHDHPIIGAIVKAFYKGRENENALYEAFVIDEKERLLGSIDRLLIVDPVKKICRVQDFKTNADVNRTQQVKKLLPPFIDLDNTPLQSYWLQLSFYARILENAGWTVEGLDIFALEGVAKWQTYTRKPIKLEKELFSAN